MIYLTSLFLIFKLVNIFKNVMPSLLYLCPSQYGSKTMFRLRIVLLPGQINECLWLTRTAIFLVTYLYQKLNKLSTCIDVWQSKVLNHCTWKASCFHLLDRNIGIETLLMGKNFKPSEQHTLKELHFISFPRTRQLRRMKPGLAARLKHSCKIVK